MNQALTVLLLLALFACGSNNNDSHKISKRDSLVSKFLDITDSLPWTDTVDHQRKLLLAYRNDDTAYLRRTVEEVQDLMKFRDEFSRRPSCPETSGLDITTFEEAYKFEYGTAFCNQGITIIVGERNDSVLLLGYHNKFDYFTDSCLSYTYIEKPLTKAQWEIIQQHTLRADFWGLKPKNDRNGVDGSGLTVTGYQRPVNAFQGRYHKVYRWAAEKMALGELFKNVLDLTQIKSHCFRFP